MKKLGPVTESMFMKILESVLSEAVKKGMGSWF
jgi:hypothetical protein